MRRRLRSTGTSTTPFSAAGRVLPPRSPPNRSGPYLPRPTHDILVVGQLLHSHRPARVEPVGGDPDLGIHPELAAIGELCRGVVQDDCAVDPLQEALC